MPHVYLKFKEQIVSGETLFSAFKPISELVAQHFNLAQQFVTIEALPQTAWTIHRKDVDVEISLNCDPERRRVLVARPLADELIEWLSTFLKNQGIHCEISVWIQMYAEGVFLSR